MKRILALLLSMGMIFTFVGCSKNDTDNKQDKDEWYNKALSILGEFKDETEVICVRRAGGAGIPKAMVH